MFILLFFFLIQLSTNKEIMWFILTPSFLPRCYYWKIMFLYFIHSTCNIYLWNTYFVPSNVATLPWARGEKTFPWCKICMIFFPNLSKLHQPVLLILSLWQLTNFSSSLVNHSYPQSCLHHQPWLLFSLISSKSFDKSRMISVPERKAVSTQRTVELKPQITIKVIDIDWHPCVDSTKTGKQRNSTLLTK